MSGFSDPILTGDGSLIRESAHSPNYTPGSSGWSIDKDGSAEFNDVTARGRVEIGPDDGPQVVIDQETIVQLTGVIRLPTHAPTELDSALIRTFLNNSGLPNEAAALSISGPQSQGATGRATLTLNAQNNDGTSNANFSLRTDPVSVFFGERTTLTLQPEDRIIIKHPSGGNLNTLDVRAGLTSLTGALKLGPTTINLYQRGKATLNFAAVSVVTQTVTFPVGFSSSPNVNVTIETGNNVIDYCVKIRQLSTASFNVQVRERTNTAVTDTVIVHWRAEN